MKLTCLTIAALIVPGLSYCGTATVHGYSRSLVMHPTVAYHRVTGGAVPIYFSTPDSAHNLPMYVPPVGTNTGIIVSSELVPVPNSYTYRVGFSFWSGSFASQSGLLSIQIPLRDIDRNGIRDLFQPDLTMYEGVTGRARQSWPSTNYSKFEARLSRAAGEYLGAYSGYLMGTNLANYAFTGGLSLLHLAGEATYERGATNLLTLNLTRVGKDGTPMQISGTAIYKASASYILLPGMVLTNESGAVFATKSATLNRSKSRYAGTLAFVDGDLETPWPDYKNWTLEILDATDGNTNGIPDLSDSDYRPPVVAITSPSQTVRTRLLPFTVRGTASDSTGVSLVEYRLEAGAETTGIGAAEGTTQWRITLESLTPGTNTLWVTATDRLGITSAPVRRVIVYTGQ